VTPSRPKAKFQSLPATLRRLKLNSIPSCSKASRVFSSCCGYPASSLDTHFHRAPRWDSSPVVIPFMHVGNYPTRNYATLERL